MNLVRVCCGWPLMNWRMRLPNPRQIPAWLAAVGRLFCRPGRRASPARTADVAALTPPGSTDEASLTCCPFPAERLAVRQALAERLAVRRQQAQLPPPYPLRITMLKRFFNLLKDTVDAWSADEASRQAAPGLLQYFHHCPVYCAAFGTGGAGCQGQIAAQLGPQLTPEQVQQELIDQIGEFVGLKAPRLSPTWW